MNKRKSRCPMPFTSGFLHTPPSFYHRGIIHTGTHHLVNTRKADIMLKREMEGTETVNLDHCLMKASRVGSRL